MEQLELIDILEEMELKIKSFNGLQNKSAKLCQRVSDIREKYKTVVIDEQFQETYDSLLQKGRMLNANHFRVTMDAKQLAENITHYTNYLYAAHGDITGQTSSLTGFYRLFLLCSILVMLLSPMVVSPVFALVFLLPIFMASRGIKQRTKIGYTLSLTVGAAGLITSSLWVKYLFYVLTDYQTMLSNFVELNGFGAQISQVLILLLPILGTALFVLTLLFVWKSYKVKNLFV